MKVVSNLLPFRSPWSVVKFCLALCAMLFGLSLPAHAQQSKVYRIGVLLPGGALHEIVEGLREGLRQLGLQEGKQLLWQSVIRRVTQRSPKRKPRVLKETSSILYMPSPFL